MGAGPLLATLPPTPQPTPHAMEDEDHLYAIIYIEVAVDDPNLKNTTETSDEHDLCLKQNNISVYFKSWIKKSCLMKLMANILDQEVLILVDGGLSS